MEERKGFVTETDVKVFVVALGGGWGVRALELHGDSRWRRNGIGRGIFENGEAAVVCGFGDFQELGTQIHSDVHLGKGEGEEESKHELAGQI
jgi:hypothetical protein